MTSLGQMYSLLTIIYTFVLDRAMLMKYKDHLSSIQEAEDHGRSPYVTMAKNK